MANLIQELQALRNYCAELDWFTRLQFPNDKTQPTSDRYSSHAVHRLDLGAATRLLFGRVVDTMAYAHWYKVLPDQAVAPLPCCFTAQGSLTPMGARDINPLQPNTNVLFALSPTCSYGCILGVLPPAMTQARLGLSDFITQASRCGIQVDRAHAMPFDLPRSGGIIDWSAGRPADGLTCGERGWLASLGGMVFVDDFMAALRADENCGLWAFYHDQLLRLAGHNLQIWTGGHCQEYVDDQGEANFFRGVTPYPWEMLGAASREAQVAKENGPEVSQVSQPHYAAVEPLVDDQRPFWRCQDYSGYLGQGGLRLLALPPQEGAQTTPFAYANPLVTPGVFHEHMALSGAYALASAKRLSIGKRPLLLIPNPTKRLDQPEDDYKAAGAYGTGTDHAIKGDFEFSDLEDEEPLQRAAGSLDMAAFTYGWEWAHPFHYHTTKFELPEEQEATSLPAPAWVPDYSSAAGKPFMSPGEPIELDVDHRYQKAKYYPGSASLDFTDDGGIVLSDAWGSSLVMTGGNIYLSAALDVFLMPGRSLVNWSGQDSVIRARNSVDITAGKDVRSKAEQHNWMLAGNGGSGAILLESRSEGDTNDFENKVGEDVQASGIILKTEKSRLMALGKELLFRTPEEGGQGMTFDAGNGQQAITTRSLSFTRFVSSTCADHFGVEGSVEASVVWAESRSAIGMPVDVKGMLLVQGQALVQKGVFVAEGHFASSESESFEGKVGVLENENLSQVQEALQQVESLDNSNTSQGTQSLQRLEQSVENETGGAHALDDATFSLRNKDQYGTASFVLYEHRWQQMARLANQELQQWEEEAVEAGSEETYPYPGKEPWSEDQAYRTMNLSLVDLAQGRSHNRGSPFEAPRFEAPSQATLSEGYKVVGGSGGGGEGSTDPGGPVEEAEAGPAPQEV